MGVVKISHTVASRPELSLEASSHLPAALFYLFFILLLITTDLLASFGKTLILPQITSSMTRRLGGALTLEATLGIPQSPWHLCPSELY